MVSLAGGAGAIVPGVIACLLFPFIAKRMPLRLLYLANGMVGCFFTLTLIVLPHAPWSFALAMLGELLFQTGAYYIQIATVFETVGPNNPLAATTFAFLTAATNISVTYMMVADGRGYAMGGVAGTLAMDAGTGITECMLLGLLLSRLPGKAFSAK